MAVVLVTGCGSGIGPLAALAFARRGDRVYATARAPARAGAVVRAAADEGLDLRVDQLDVTDDASVDSCVGRVLEDAGRIDVLVNNAGVLHLGSVETLPEERLRETFETNFFGVVRTTGAVLPAMRAQRSGTIVNVASAAGLIASPPMNWSYAASKAAVIKLSDALAWEVEPFGIKVVCLEPGFYGTELLTKAARPTDPDSPYRQHEDAIVSFFDQGIEGAPDAQTVASAIVAAVDLPLDATSVHVLVGEDSEHFANAYRAMSEREYKTMVRPIYGF
jgi:NAD(P)-dependent dehydrogenase (short-subunit alcohol dehydrogenase family)